MSPKNQLKTPHNNVLPQLALTCKIETEVLLSTFVQVDSELLQINNCCNTQTAVWHLTNEHKNNH